MLSFYFRVRGGSDLNNKKSRGHGGGHGGAWRIQVHSWIQCLWPFGQKETILNEGSQALDHRDQVEKETAPKVPKEAAPEDMKEFVPNVCGLSDPKVSGPNKPKESASKDTQMAQRDPVKSPFNSRDLLLDNMLTSMQEEDRHALITFMCTSSLNSTIQQVLDLIFRGYDYEGDEEVKNAKDQEHGIDNNQNIGVLCLLESSSLISPQVEKESSPKEPAPIVLKKTDPEERKEFVPNDLEESGPKDAKECGPKELRVFAQRSQRSCASTLWMCWWITC
ncbi:hypothetical protein LEMLEM_LOCUS9898 [Lemmus lemmus]